MANMSVTIRLFYMMVEITKLVIGKVIFAEADYDLLFQFYLVIVGFLFIAFIIRTDFFIENDGKSEVEKKQSIN